MKKQSKPHKSISRTTLSKLRKSSRFNKVVALAVVVIVALAGFTLFTALAVNHFASVKFGNGSSGASKVSDNRASGGNALRFGEKQSAPDPDPPAGNMPSRQWIKNNAGPSNESILQNSGNITVNNDGAVVENVNVNGIITVKANNVTIRNCKVRGYSNVYVIRAYPEYKNLTVKNCRVEALESDGKGPNGAIGGGSNVNVSHTEVLGLADGIKAESNSLYEYNYIHMYKPAGSAKHLDGIQGSGDTNWTARYNFIDMDIEDGANFALFAQAWNGSNCIPITNIEFSNNYVNGGNYAISFAGGKDSKCANPSSYISNARMLNNVFIVDSDGVLGKTSTKGYRYGYYSLNNTGNAVTISGNKLSDGRAITGGNSPHP